ncbi:MAG TPA: hypothetical protein VJ898_03340 [Natrialbaceae archaeon]|nr:hypothetical protein [Natrialbaceae archaeon]
MDRAWLAALSAVLSTGRPSDRIERSVPSESHARRRWLLRLIAVLLLLLAGFAFGWAIGTVL